MSSDAYASLIRGIVIPVAIGLVFGLARRYLPARAKRVSAEDAIESAGLQVYVTVAILVSMAAIAGGSFYFLKGLNYLWAQTGPKPERMLLPDYVDWMFFPIFGGICLGWELVFQIWARFINRRKAETYDAWSTEKVGFDSTRVLRWMALLIALPVTGIELMLVPVHDSFYADHIAIGRFGRIATENHAYSTVRYFETYQGIRGKGGRLSRQPTIVLKFDDGAEWSSWTTREDMVPDRRMVEYLTGKIGRPPVERETAE